MKKQHPVLLSENLRQIQSEWKAIQKAAGFRGGFPHWRTTQAELPHLHFFPTVERLQLVEHVLITHIQLEVRNYRLKQRKHAQYMIQVDIHKFGKQEAYAQIRGQTAGLIQHVPVQQQVVTERVAAPSFGLVQVKLPKYTSIDLTHCVQLGQHQATIVDWQPPFLEQIGRAHV